MNVITIQLADKVGNDTLKERVIKLVNKLQLGRLSGKGYRELINIHNKLVGDDREAQAHTG